MKYNPNEIETKWQEYWKNNQTFAAQNNSEKPKYYVLDMFPYPSGAGLHVGHPLGYIASDVYSRYKRHRGFNVLHPMGYDSFGLPAEQYAIQTGQRPEDTTSVNIDGGVDKEGNEIAGYRKQLDKIGFSFDWSREVRTSNPDYYKQTQWIFIQLFNSWYNKNTDKAEDISTLIAIFETEGNASVNAVCDDSIQSFSSKEWNGFSSVKQQRILLQYRLTYLAETEVNWCPGLGTVLANDEIVNGVSERGGFQVIRKKMTQWSMRISAYAERLLQGLNDIDWSESIKESQRNWIGKSVGALVTFPVLTANVNSENSTHLLLEKAQELKSNPTETEQRLWQSLKSKALDYNFRHQYLIEDYIIDFVCLSKKLVIVINEEIQDFQQVANVERAKVITEKGFKIIRFNKEEIIRNIEGVLDTITQELDEIVGSASEIKKIEVFTTRPDTIFGVTFMTLAPEHELVSQITTPEQKAAVDAYIEKTAKRSERERMADVKTISGVFTGAYAEHPFTKEPIPVWIGDYVLAGYGTGAVMAVPCGDERDYAFTNFFKRQNGMPEIRNIFDKDISEAAFGAKEGFKIVNSDFLNGMGYKEATKKAIEELEKLNQGKGKINYRLRDAVFSRQRYWGEPFPVYYVNGLPQMIDKQYLPIKLPAVEKYLPTEDGQPPLGNALVWAWDSVQCSVVSNQLIDNVTIFPLELNTMPGWAGSSWYWMRYMDAQNDGEFASKDALKYWESVDLYIGGSEHATGHLLYSRFWNKFLKDKGFAPTEEPFKKLINQGMILGMSAFVARYQVNYEVKYYLKDKIKSESDLNDENLHETTSLEGKVFVSKTNLIKNSNSNSGYDVSNIVEEKVYEDTKRRQEKVLKDGYSVDYVITLEKKSSNISFIPVDVNLVNSSDEILITDLKNWRVEFKNFEIIGEENSVLTIREIEKMSKSKYNVVTPDDICNEYGADTLRLYEMFLGPLEQAKPWNTAGISGVFGFLKKLWRLYFDDNGLIVTNNTPSKDSLKSLHKTIKKVAEDIEGFSFNTSVSQFMICVNELSTQRCHERAILEPLTILISSYAPHIAEELWSQLGNSGSIATVAFPTLNEKHLVESSKEYPVSFNGKMRFTIELSLDLTVPEIQEIIMKDARTLKQLDGKMPNKIIIVPGKVINLVG